MQVVKIEKKEGIAFLTIDRVESLNALNSQMIAQMHAALKELDDDARVRAVILTGAGEKAFIAGADIAELESMHIHDVASYISSGQSLFLKLEQMQKPVIAAINGFALGGGCELAMACDIRICSENARFGLPEVKMGIFPGFGGTQRLPGIVGRSHAMRLILTGDTIDAQTAEKIGLTDHVTTQAELMPEAEKLAKRISSNAPLAVGYAKKAVNYGVISNREGYGYEMRLFRDCFATGDKAEGMRAFLEKRTPCFQGK